MKKLQKLTIYSSTLLQGLLLLARHDVTLLTSVEKTGIFNTMFSPPAKKATYLILKDAEQVAAFQYAYVPSKKSLASEQLLCIDRIIKSLETAIEVNSTAYPREAFLTAIALSIKIFLQTVLRYTTNPEEDSESTAVQLMEIFQRPDQQLPSSLALCSSLESVFWQTMMGAIAAPDARTKSFFNSRLEKITAAMALTSWHDASTILERFFWIPFIFSAPGCQILSGMLHPRDHADV